MTPEERDSKKFMKWYTKGLKAGWIAEIVCATHECLPCTEEEEDFADGGDPCMLALRVWPS